MSVLPFIIVGSVGIVLLLVSLVFGELFDFLDGTLSGTGLGAALATFGAVGLVVTGFGWPTWLAYALSAVLGILILLLVRAFVGRLRRSEDGEAPSPLGLYGTARSTITVTSGEVSLDGPNEIETRMAFSEARIEAGTRIRVVEQQGSRVKVAPASSGDEGSS